MMKPTIQALLLARQIYQDVNTRRFSIVETIDEIHVRAVSDSDGKGRVDGFWFVYLAVIGVTKTEHLTLQLVDLSDASVVNKWSETVKGRGDPFESFKEGMRLPQLMLRPGPHSLEIWTDDEEILGSYRFRVVETAKGKRIQEPIVGAGG